MFRQTYQSGLLSILSSQGSKPLDTWVCKVSNGYIKRITDENTNSLVLELSSTNVSSTYVTCPACPYDSLGIKMQYLNLYIKNLRRYFVMEIEVLDSENMHRRFKISTFATKTKIGPFGTHSPLNWIEGWNRLTLNLESFTKTVYASNYVECRRITIHANCRIRRVFFADREYKEEELPLEYQLRCRIDRPKRHVPLRRMYTLKKSTYESKSDQNQFKLPFNSGQIDSTKKEIPTQLMTMEESIPNDPMMNAPQGSIASDVQQVDDLSDHEKHSEIEPTMIDEINNLHLEPEDKQSIDEINMSSNAYRQRYFDLYPR